MTLRLVESIQNNGIPFYVWDDVTSMMDWQQGEHVTIIGPTGQGKTTLAQALLPLRTWTLILATKPKDDTLEDYIQKGRYHKIEHWPPHSSWRRVILWPPVKGGDTGKQEAAIDDALKAIYDSGGWTVLIDELWHATNILGQQRMIELLLMQGRSLGVSVIVGAQRPAHVPLVVYDQATHLFLFGDKDEANVRRMGGLGYFTKHEIMDAISTLQRHEVLYLNTRDGYMARTKVTR